MQPIFDFESTLKDLTTENFHLKKEIEFLETQIAELKRQLFGTKKERWVSDEQLVIEFNECDREAISTAIDSSEDESISEVHIDAEGTIEVTAHTKKKRGHRHALPAHLPRRIEVIELQNEERKDENGNELVVIGYEVSEKLFYTPSTLEVLELRRAKYGRAAGDYVKTADHFPDLFPKSIATPELVSNLVVNKYSYGLPLYRVEDIFRRLGVDLSRTTMARWMILLAEKLEPIYRLLEEDLLESGYVSADETPVQVLKEKGKTAESISYMWVRATPSRSKENGKIILFTYSPTRASSNAKELFNGFQGVLQCDGYSGYDFLNNEDKITRIGCCMHARRYFEKAFKAGSDSGMGSAAVAMKYFKTLYKLEDKTREMTFEDRHFERQKHQVPLWNAFKAWAENYKDSVSIKSPLGKAFQYFFNEYAYFTGYLKAGHLEMDNGFIERQIRKFAIGRNNWLFSDTEAGAKASAILYSFVLTAKINQIDPYTAFCDAIRLLPKVELLTDCEKIANLFTIKANTSKS